jgi:hypothetical protein
MIEPRRVTLTLGDIRGLTILEAARANSAADVRQSDVGRLLRILDNPGAEPALIEKAFTLLYAYAWQLERRADPSTTWEAAQTWRVTVDVSAVNAEADSDAVTSVRAAVVTGLPPDEAGKLTLAQMDEYRSIAAERERAAKRGRKRAG